MRAVLFANGRMSQPALDRAQLRQDDWIIAADGGLRNCMALGLKPAVVIGDFDSVEEENLQAPQLSGALLIRHPARKDETDLELAVIHAVRQGAQEIVVLGALGERWDQTLANVLLMAGLEAQGADMRLLDGPQEIRLVRAGQTLAVEGQAGDTLSLIPLKGDARGIDTSGLEYPLERGTLRFGATRGLSNTLVGHSATVRLEKGLLACIHIRSLPTNAR